MRLHDFGNSLISHDIKRLKKRFRSLEKDLDSYFEIHQNTLSEMGRLSCEIYSDKEVIICKERIGLTIPKTPPSKGARLWFVILKDNGHYIRCLLYAANEEKAYPKRVCFKRVHGVIKSLVES